MNNFRSLAWRDIQYWAALATILTLFMSVLQWLYPNPLGKSDSAPFVFSTIPNSNMGSDENPLNAVRVVESDTFYLPWTKLLTKIYDYSPPETWWLLSITFSVVSFIIGITFFNNAIDNEQFKILAGFVFFIAGIWLSIYHWGWWGILIGVFVSMLLMWLIAFGLAWGGILGIITGGIIGVGVTLLVVAFFGNFIESYLVVGNILGSVIGALLGGILGNSL
jgi:hypothetical protein